MPAGDRVARTIARRPRGLSGLAVGFLVGVLVTALVAPDHARVTTEAAAGGPRRGTTAGAPTAPTDLGGGGGEAAGDTGPSNTVAGSAGGSGGAAVPGSASATGASGGTATSAGTASAGGGGATAPGVKADSIRIGFGLPDIGAIAALGPGYDQGDPHKHVEAILGELRAEKRLPVNGRDITPVYRTYNIISQDAQRAACEGFGKDDGVFGVIAIHDVGVGAECIAREFKLPLITTDGQPAAVYQRSWPNLFTLQMSFDRMLRNFVEWASTNGYLKGKKVGVYYPSDPELAQMTEQSLIKTLESKGVDVAAKVQTDNYTTGGPTDSVAVQQFRAAGVNVGILLVSAVAKTNFFNQAQAQGYHPLYLENDFGFSSTDTATSTYPAQYFDGTRAFTGMRFGEGRAGIPENAQAQWCRQALQKRAGIVLDRERREAEYIAANQACDEILIALDAIQRAGPNLTRAAFVAALEGVRGRPAGIHSDVTFGAQRHDGASSWRTLRWAAGCKCWNAEGNFAPLWVE